VEERGLSKSGRQALVCLSKIDGWKGIDRVDGLLASKRAFCKAWGIGRRLDQKKIRRFGVVFPYFFFYKSMFTKFRMWFPSERFPSLCSSLTLLASL